MRYGGHGLTPVSYVPLAHKGSLSCPLRAHEEALLVCPMFVRNLLLQDSGVLMEML